MILAHTKTSETISCIGQLFLSFHWLTLLRLYNFLFFLCQLDYDDFLRAYSTSHLSNVISLFPCPFIGLHSDCTTFLFFLCQLDYDDFLRGHLGEHPGAIKEFESGDTVGEHRGLWYASYMYVYIYICVVNIPICIGTLCFYHFQSVDSQQYRMSLDDNIQIRHNCRCMKAGNHL